LTIFLLFDDNAAHTIKALYGFNLVIGENDRRYLHVPRDRLREFRRCVVESDLECLEIR